MADFVDNFSRSNAKSPIPPRVHLMGVFLAASFSFPAAPVGRSEVLNVRCPSLGNRWWSPSVIKIRCLLWLAFQSEVDAFFPGTGSGSIADANPSAPPVDGLHPAVREFPLPRVFVISITTIFQFSP